MELIAVARLLWRCRLLVLLGAVLAIAAAVVLGPGPTPSRGFALTRVLLDSSRSELAEEATFGADTLPWRATLASQTLATETNRRAIAAGAGVRPGQFDITDVELVNPTVPASLPHAATQAAYSSGKPYTIEIHADGAVPIITISALTPDRSSAMKLAESAVAALKTYTEAPANSERMGLQVRTVSPLDSVTIPGGRGRKKMAMIALVLVSMWMVVVALMPLTLGAVRRALQHADAAYP